MNCPAKKTTLTSLPLNARPARRDELSRWRDLMRRHHYLGFKRIVGEALYYAATLQEEWVALLGWGSAALKCAAKDTWIGWDQHLQFKRLHLIANNIRFLILPNCHIPNLASRVLALNLKRLSRDWQTYHGHPIVLVETFVDLNLTAFPPGSNELCGQAQNSTITSTFPTQHRFFASNEIQPN